MLTVQDLSVEYSDGKRAIDSVNFNISPSESVALIGANGAGKTSLLLALVGVLSAKSGHIKVHDMELNKKTRGDFRTRVGLVFQNPDDQLFMANVYEDVAFGPRSFGSDEEESKTRVTTVLDSLNIRHLEKRSPLKLSGGEKRLAAVATVLSMNPDFILFDEPTAFLDPKAQRNLKNIIQNLPQGKLIATHDLSFAAQTCSRVIILKDGQVLADDSTEVLKNTALLEAAGL